MCCSMLHGMPCRSGSGNTASSGCMRRQAAASRHLRISVNLLGQNPPEDAVAALGVPWQPPIAEHTPVVVAVAAASTYIMTLSAFCDRGRSVLAMLLHRPPSSVPLTLTVVFHMGWINVSMGLGHSAGTLWLADLSGSQLPRMLSSQADVAYLRLNGDMQG